MGSHAAKEHADHAGMPFLLPITTGLQQRQQFVGSPEFTLAKIRRHNRLDGPTIPPRKRDSVSEKNFSNMGSACLSIGHCGPAST